MGLEGLAAAFEKSLTSAGLLIGPAPRIHPQAIRVHHDLNVEAASPSRLKRQRGCSKFLPLGATGLNKDSAGNLSLAVTKRLQDVAAFQGVDANAAFEQLFGAFIGRPEALAALGIAPGGANAILGDRAANATEQEHFLA